MSKINCIIVEDEPLAVKILSEYVSKVPFLELQGTFRDAILAAEHLRDHHCDLMFLDIHLPKLKGMAFLKTLAHPPAVVITTAYHQYAVEGFDLNVADYLLKPFDFARFLAAVTKVRIARKEKGEGREEKDFFFVSVQKKKVKIFLAEILYIESQREYIKIVTTKKELTSKMSTHDIEALLPGHLFKRIHRSFIVSLARIDSYTAETVEVNGVSLPVGRSYRKTIENL